MLLAVSDIASWFAQPFVCDNNIHCVNNRTQSVNGHTGAVATMTAVLTAGERLHKTPEETVSFLQSGILLGRVGEGTPDAAYVMIDLRETEDGFVPQQRENDAVVESGDVRVGMLPWWYWQPWWWWWWTPRGRRGRGRVRMRMRMDGSADFEDIDADIRIGIREREDPSDRFELGVIELSIDGSNTPFRTLVCYKESRHNAPLDPLDANPTWTWTGTWRDPRFSPPADGGKPENNLTGG